MDRQRDYVLEVRWRRIAAAFSVLLGVYLTFLAWAAWTDSFGVRDGWAASFGAPLFSLLALTLLSWYLGNVVGFFKKTVEPVHVRSGDAIDLIVVDDNIEKLLVKYLGREKLHFVLLVSEMQATENVFSPVSGWQKDNFNEEIMQSLLTGRIMSIGTELHDGRDHEVRMEMCKFVESLHGGLTDLRASVEGFRGGSLTYFMLDPEFGAITFHSLGAGFALYCLTLDQNFVHSSFRDAADDLAHSLRTNLGAKV